jgi:hypothetical protein
VFGLERLAHASGLDVEQVNRLAPRPMRAASLTTGGKP